MIKDGVILVIICVFVGAGFWVWQSRVQVHSLRAPDSQVQAQAIATRMGWQYEYRRTGYGNLATKLEIAVSRNEEVVAWRR